MKTENEKENSAGECAEDLTALFGSRVFNDAVMRKRLPPDVYTSLRSTVATGGALDLSLADTVAEAMKEWAVEHGATHFTHWFQPMTAITAEKHDSFLAGNKDGRAVLSLSGKSLIQGEPDASSFPTGGLRATCAARGYTAWDPSSYAFIRGTTLYIPTAFCSYTGEALDYKTPLLRSMDTISREALRILKLFGNTEAKRVTPMVGAEQEYFLIDRELFLAREDLCYTGRTLFGCPAPHHGQTKAHYLGPIPSQVAAFMQKLDRELWSMGIMCVSEHNEAAPAQFELAPLFTSASMAIDQNLLMMDTMKNIARECGMECLLHEKPFLGVNGSGKHNNWSLSTDNGQNLLTPGKNPVENTQFLLFLAAVVKAVDEYSGLLRLSVASASNDFRLGGDEAPPAIVSIFMGEELEEIIHSIITGQVCPKSSGGKMNLGIVSIPEFEKDTTDRNRTSPFAFTGNKFEFRMPGSSMNLAMANVVLNTTVASALKSFADELEKADNLEAAMADLIRRTFTEHQRILFNGDGYSAAWTEEAKARGLSILPSAPDAIKIFDAPENVKLFTEFGVFSESEIEARKYILFETYSAQVLTEARTMLSMSRERILPALAAYTGRLASSARDKTAVAGKASAFVETALIKKLSALEKSVFELTETLSEKIAYARGASDMEERSVRFCHEVIPVMNELRRTVDTAERLSDRSAWPYPSYGEMILKPM